VESDGDTDGGVWVEPHTGYYLLYGSNAYKVGLHIMPGSGQVGIQGDSNLGATTSAPTNSIICEGDGTTKTAPVIVSHSQGTVTLGANRDILVGDNVMLRLSTYSASSRLVVRGAIDCVNRENGVLKIGDYSTGAVVLETTGGRTNHLGRLFVTQPLIIGGGTTLLENTTKLERGTGSNDEGWSINNGSPLHISGSGHLMVTGGVLKVLGSRRSILKIRHRRQSALQRLPATLRNLMNTSMIIRSWHLQSTADCFMSWVWLSRASLSLICLVLPASRLAHTLLQALLLTSLMRSFRQLWTYRLPPASQLMPLP
jgi:hypothetical protein